MTALFAQGRHPVTGALLGRRYQAGAASSEFAHLVNKAIVVHNTALGRPSKAWVTDSEWTAIRSAVATEMFTAAKGRVPGIEELASTLRAVSQSRVGIAGFDLAFTAPKSISALWAVVDPDAAATIEEAHRAAVIDTVRWLERHAAYIRLQDSYAVVNTGRFVKTRGFIAAAFVHRDSRAGDPNLHMHVAVSNKVQTADGRWRGVQGRLLKQARAAAAARYETRLEANLSSSLGIGFADRPSGAGRLAGQVRQPSVTSSGSIHDS